jgi:aminocarboxymuconate-semialdehyde decarboxylase
LTVIYIFLFYLLSFPKITMVVIVEGKRILKVDSHSHILPRDWEPSNMGDKIPLRLVHYDRPTEKGFVGRMEFTSDGRLFREIKENIFNADAVLKDCDECGVDVQVICTVPVLFNYNLAPDVTTPWAQFLNDDIARTCASHPQRLIGLGTLPLQDTQASIIELRRCHELGLRGIQIGSHVNAYRVVNGEPKVVNLPLNHPDLIPVWEECERLGTAILLHPWDMEPWCDNQYWQPWLVGMPTETALGGTALLLGGVMSRFPGLKVMLSHGGGALPYLMGRITWGYKCRPDLVAKDCKEMPREVLKRFYFDSITHDEEALQFMVRQVGPHKVMLGSDYPFPLGEVKSVAPVTGELLGAYPGELLESSRFSLEAKQAMLGGTALGWLGIPVEAYDAYLADDIHASARVVHSHCPVSDTLP